MILWSHKQKKQVPIRSTAWLHSIKRGTDMAQSSRAQREFLCVYIMCNQLGHCFWWQLLDCTGRMEFYSLVQWPDEWHTADNLDNNGGLWQQYVDFIGSPLHLSIILTLKNILYWWWSILQISSEEELTEQHLHLWLIRMRMEVQ